MVLGQLTNHTETYIYYIIYKIKQTPEELMAQM